MEVKFENNTLKKRFKSMLSVDFRRMFTSTTFYLMVSICLVIPILILVMTTMMDGSVSVDPQTGKETVMEGFKNVWEIIGSVSGGEASSSMNMSLTSMCNINLVYFLISVFVCLFIADDFRSGYSKNLFTVRAKKTDYVLSKIIIGFVAGASMLVAFFFGSMIGGAIANLPFALKGVTVVQIVMCMLSKIFLSLIFVSIYVLASVFAKQKLWLSILLSLGIGMLFFTMVPMISPLNSGILNVIMTFAGGVMFAALFVYLSTLILNKLDIL